MSQPGWYPDPSGQPGQFRFWNGARWSQETTPNPCQTPPPVGAGFGGQGAGGKGGRGRWWMLIVGIIAVALVAVLVVRTINGRSTIAEDTNSSTPTVSQWDETSSPTQTPTPTNPDSSGGSQRTCPFLQANNPSASQGDRLEGGGISYVAVPGWAPVTRPLVDYAEDQAGQTTTVFKLWIAGIAIGQVNKADFGDDAKTAATRIFSCEASSQYYPGYQGHSVRSQEAITIDGRTGWRLKGEVRDNHYPEVKGDVLDIIVLDAGRDGKFAFYKGMSPIDQPAFQTLVDAATATIQVVG